MIPAKIHYCWFGGKPIPKIYLKYIETWKAYFPGYELIEWNEKNFDVRCNAYVNEAYKLKKWAFVSDYARFKILYENGGVYFDTDVEVIKDFSEIIMKGPFMGMERQFSHSGRAEFGVAPGLGLGAEPEMELYKRILDGYENRNFVLPDGNIDSTTVVEYTTDILSKLGFQSDKNELQIIQGVNIYPTEYFCPIDFFTTKMNITENTVSIHRYNGSWMPLKSKVSKRVKNIIGPIMTEKILRLLSNSKNKGIF